MSRSQVLHYIGSKEGLRSGSNYEYSAVKCKCEGVKVVMRVCAVKCKREGSDEGVNGCRRPGRPMSGCMPYPC